MAIDRNNKKPSESGGFLATVERYWLVLLGLIIGYPIIMRYFRDAGTKDKINNIEENEKVLVKVTQNPVTQIDELNKVTTNTYYHNIARGIAVSFHTDVLTKENDTFFASLFSPSTWVVDHAKAFFNLNAIKNTGQKTVVTKLYYILTRRDLNYDVKNKLKDEYLNKLPLFK